MKNVIPVMIAIFLSACENNPEYQTATNSEPPVVIVRPQVIRVDVETFTSPREVYLPDSDEVVHPISFTGVNKVNSESNYKLILVRHAEKTTEGFDPGLTRIGHLRAEFFASWPENMEMKAIWSSDYKRTRDTAAPLAQKLGIEISYYDPRNQQELVKKLKNAEVNAFVVGHSNTIPELASLLCTCEIESMNDQQYDRAFQIVQVDGMTGMSEIDLEKLWVDRPETTH